MRLATAPVNWNKTMPFDLALRSELSLRLVVTAIPYAGEIGGSAAHGRRFLTKGSVGGPLDPRSGRDSFDGSYCVLKRYVAPRTMVDNTPLIIASALFT